MFQIQQGVFKPLTMNVQVLIPWLFHFAGLLKPKHLVSKLTRSGLESVSNLFTF